MLCCRQHSGMTFRTRTIPDLCEASPLFYWLFLIVDVCAACILLFFILSRDVNHAPLSGLLVLFGGLVYLFFVATTLTWSWWVYICSNDRVYKSGEFEPAHHRQFYSHPWMGTIIFFNLLHVVPILLMRYLKQDS